MKGLICLAVLVVAVSAVEPEFVAKMKQKMKEHVEGCVKQEGASADDLNALLSHQMPSSHEGKCAIFCMHKLFNGQNDDGSLNMPGAISTMEIIKDPAPEIYNIMMQTFKKCESTPTDSDPCIFAANLATCIKTESKALGLEQAVVE